MAVLDFFATWCAPCKPEMADLRAARRRFDRDAVSIVSITAETDRDQVERFWRQYRGTWPVALDPDLEATRRYDVAGVPRTRQVLARLAEVPPRAGRLRARRSGDHGLSPGGRTTPFWGLGPPFRQQPRVRGRSGPLASTATNVDGANPDPSGMTHAIRGSETVRQETDPIHETGIDAAAVKPAECDVSAAAALPLDTVTVDFEGREHLPDPEVLADLVEAVSELRVTVPVRADGFDPLGDDAVFDLIPEGAKTVLVAGNPAYLSRVECRRPVAPRLGAAVERTSDPWVGTEGIERLALATGATQFTLLSRRTDREFRALRAAGFDGDLAVYAPTVLDDDPDAVLDAVGGYVARRAPVRAALPDDARTDAAASGRVREVLLDACRDYALVGSTRQVSARVAALREAGANRVVGYPARGLDAFGVRR